MGNVCEVSSISGPECGTDLRHLHQFLIAERLCMYAVADHIDRQEKPTEVQGREQGQLAWDTFELGIATAGDGLSAACVAIAKDKFGRDCATKRPPSDKWFTAAKAQAYMPAILERHNGTLTLETMQQVYAGLGKITDVMLLPNIGDGVRTKAHIQGDLAEVAIESALARLCNPNFFPFGASNRENRGLLKVPQYNHDSYLVRGGVKLPLQVKYGKIHDDPELNKVTYDPRVLMISYREMVTAAVTAYQERYHEAHMAAWPFSGVLLLSTLAKEARGDEIDDHEQSLLRRLSHAVLRKVVAHETMLRKEGLVVNAD